jgi:two-component system, NtrC family, response regulator PilR
MKVLVVDDEELVRWFLERALRKSGYEVVTAANISDASAKLESDKIDILILDLRMPGGSGMELIRKMEGVVQQPKMVVCSAFITPELEQEFRKKGIGILRKPFKIDELNRTVQQCSRT